MIQLQLANALRVDGLAGGPRALAAADAVLLAWLAIEGATPRARLAALLWPDKDLDLARNTLRQRLFQLRRSVGVELVSGSGTLALADAVAHDLDGADTLLADVPLGELAAGELSAWLQHQRERRRGRRRAAMVARFDAAEQARDWPDAFALARELLALEPLSEEAHRRLIRLHYVAGDRAAALLAFDRCEQVLKDEIGVAPSAETTALLATIEREAAGHALPARAAIPAALLRPPRVVGREAELGLLRRALEGGATVLLAGEAGSGKSRLLAALGAAAGRRLVGVGARPGDGLVPYALAARLLRALLAVGKVAPAEGRRGFLARVLPEFGTPSPGTPAEVLAQLAAAVEELVEQVAAAGVAAVVVDDLQFADAASVELLQALAGSGGVAWILAMRPAELPPAAQALVARHEAAAGTLRLALQPLAVDAVAALLEVLELPGIGGPEQAEALHRRTGGNPFYLLETLKAVLDAEPTRPGRGAVVAPTATVPGRVPVAPGPRPGLPNAEPAWPRADSVQRLIQQRLARLGPLALKAARCAAVAGNDLSAPLVAQVLGLRPLDLADAWAELEAAEVLVDGGFAHDLIAEAALASVPRAIARPLHAEVAAWLEGAGGEPGRIAAHWLAAGDPRRAAPALRAAARRADAAMRKDEAAALHAQAAALLEAAGDRAAAFDAWFCAAVAMCGGNVDARIRDWAERLDALAADEAERGYAGLVRIVVLAESRRYADAEALAAELLPLAARCGLRDLLGELHWDLAVLHWERRELADAARHAEACLAALQDLDDRSTRFDVGPTRYKAVGALGMTLTATGRFGEAAAHFEDAYRRACAAGHTTRATGMAADRAEIALACGDPVAALDWSGRAVTLVQGYVTDPAAHADELRAHAVSLAVAGELGQALQMLDRAAGQAAKGWARGAVVLDRTRAWLWFELGRRDLALRTLEPLARRDDLTPNERLLIDATCLYVGAAGVDAAAVLAAAPECRDFLLRARVLCLAQDGCDAADLLPLLTLDAATARELGAHGLWLGLQGQRVAALLRLARADDAYEQALSAWARAEQGAVGVLPFPRLAAPLCAAIAPRDADLAQTIALRASAWIQRAGAGLPQPWRDSYLRRAQALPLRHGPLLPPA